MSPRKAAKSGDAEAASVPPQARWVEEADSFDQAPLTSQAPPAEAAVDSEPAAIEQPTEVAWQEPPTPLSTPGVPDSPPAEPWAGPDSPPPVVPAPVVKRSRAKKPEPEPEPEPEPAVVSAASDPQVTALTEAADATVESGADAMDSPETSAAPIEQQPEPVAAGTFAAAAEPVLAAPSGFATLSAERPEVLIAVAFIAGSLIATTIKRLGR